MKKYINDLMRDRRNNFFDKSVKVLLYLVSLIYGLAVKLWALCYEKNILKKHKVSSRVVSVGNITVGGTGKTPFVIFLARKLKDRGKDVAALIRGYGDDEWQMLNRSLRSVTVVVGRDRVASAKKASMPSGDRIILLDDGYQHRRLARDVNVLLLDCENPFGNRHMFPRGILRESISAIRYADVAVLTKADFGRKNVGNLRGMLQSYKKEKVFESVYKPVSLIDIFSGNKLSLDVVNGKKICVLSGIADPAYFRYILEKLGAILIKDHSYLDHHNYSTNEIELLAEEAKKNECDYIITTEKDSIKLKGLNLKVKDPNILELNIELSIIDREEELVAAISGPDSSNIS